MDEGDALARTCILQHHRGQQPSPVVRERLAQPGFDCLEEQQIRLVTIHDRGARVNLRLDRIGLDQSLAEAVNGRAGQIIDLMARGREMPALLI